MKMEWPAALRNERSRTKEILNGWDRNILAKGVAGVIEGMFKHFGNKMPEVIILPDTSARPLYYALDAGMSKLVAEKQLQKPLYYFFKTHTPASMHLMAESGSEKTIETSQEMKDYFLKVLECEKQIGMEDPDMNEEKIDSIIKHANPERMSRIREVMKERAEEILKDAEKRLGHAPSIAVVDEVVASERTVKELFRAFGDVPLHSYAVTGEDAQETYIGHYNRIEFSAEKGERGGNPDRGNLNKLTYSNMPAVGVNKGVDRQDTPTDIENKYARRERQTHPRGVKRLGLQKTKLREEMRAIGEKIAAQVLEDINKSGGDQS